jgi:hypothetical protein
MVDMTTQTSLDSSPLSGATLLARAGEISSFISEQSAFSENLSRLSDDCVSALHDANLFSLFVPKALGGDEL